MTRPLTIVERLALSFEHGWWQGLLVGALLGVCVTRVWTLVWAWHR